MRNNFGWNFIYLGKVVKLLKTFKEHQNTELAALASG
jgi:hypothetical protein